MKNEQRKTNWYHRLTLSSKLALAIALSMAVALTALTGYTCWRSIDGMKERQSASEQAIISMKLSELESYYNTLKSYSISIRNDEKFMQLINMPSRDYNGGVYVQTLLRNIYYSRNDIRSFTLYLLNQGVSYSIAGNSADVKVSENPAISEMPGYRESLSSDDYLSVSPSDDPDSLFIITRTVIDISTKNPLAVIVLKVDDSFMRALSKSGTAMQSSLSLLDAGNRLFYSTDTKVVNATNMIHLSPYLVGSLSAAGLEAEILDTPYLMAYDTSPATGLRLVSLVPKAALYRDVFGLSVEIIWFALPLILLAGLTAFLLMRHFTRPLYKLAEAMGSTAEGKPAAPLKLSGSAEVSLLAGRYEAIAERIEALAKKSSAAEQGEKSARLTALEAMINPYFVCHVLQSVQLIAMRGGQTEIHSMVQTLCSMLDYSIQAEGLAPVSKEVEYVKEYLFLQRVQFNDHIDYRLDVDKKAKTLNVPKLSIQPLAESALMRGLENNCDNLFVGIKIALTDTVLTVTVEDDAGISPAQLEELKRQIGQAAISPEAGMGGTGLANLSARLSLLYGPHAAIGVSRSEDGKAVVSLRLELQEEE